MFSLIGGILLLCVLIVVHEFGHFIVAKLLGVRVLTFSVGFGPKLLKWNRGGTEYCLSAIPLGGYIKMVGESPTDELSEEDKRVSFLHQALWKKSLIALAGPLFNLILPIFLLTFIYFGQESLPLPVVGTTVPGHVAAQAGFLAGDKILKVDGKAVETFLDVNEAVVAKPNQKVRFEIERQGQRKVIEVTTIARPDPNPLNIGESVGEVGLSPFVKTPRVAVLDKSSPAAVAGVKTLDEVVAVNGQAIASFEDLERALSAQKLPIHLKIKRGEEKKAREIEVVISATSTASFEIESEIKRYAVIESEIAEPKLADVVAKTNKNLQDFTKRGSQLFGMTFIDAVAEKIHEGTAAAKAGMKDGDKIVSVNGTPVESWMQVLRHFHDHPDDIQVLGVVGDGKMRVVALRLQEPAEKKRFGPPQNKQLGVMTSYADAYTEGPMLRRDIGVVEAFGRGAEATWELGKAVGKSFFLLANRSVSTSQIGGPLTMFSVAGEATSNGVHDTLVMMSLISVNLGILNLLPVPMLDGGHLLLFFIEFVTRRPLTLKARQVAMTIGLTFILMLMALALFNDFSRLFS